MSEPHPIADTPAEQPFATAVLLAGGSGARMRGQAPDKILLPLAGQPAAAYSLVAFQEAGCIDALVIVYRDGTQRSALERLPFSSSIQLRWARGGSERYQSVLSGLEAAPEETEIALIHDCARPCVTPAAIRASIVQARRAGAACVAQPVVDTIKEARKTESGDYLLQTLDRSRLWAMGTPQSFRFRLILDAYRQVLAEGKPITDDLAAIERYGIPVAFIDNGRPNPKLTTPEDVPGIEAILSSRPLDKG